VAWSLPFFMCERLIRVSCPLPAAPCHWHWRWRWQPSAPFVILFSALCAGAVEEEEVKCLRQAPSRGMVQCLGERAALASCGRPGPPEATQGRPRNRNPVSRLTFLQ